MQTSNRQIYFFNRYLSIHDFTLLVERAVTRKEMMTSLHFKDTDNVVNSKKPSQDQSYLVKTIVDVSYIQKYTTSV